MNLNEDKFFLFSKNQSVIETVSQSLQTLGKSVEVVSRKKSEEVQDPYRILWDFSREDGVAAIEQLREQWPCPYILIVNKGDSRIADLYHVGVEAVVFKPIDHIQLVQALHRCEKMKPRSMTRAPRMEIEAKVFLTYGSGPHHEVIGNIGRGGMFVNLVEDLPKVDDVLGFRLVVQKNSQTDVIKGTGVVRWIRVGAGKNSGCGIEFTKFEDGSQKLYEQYIGSFHENAYIPKD